MSSNNVTSSPGKGGGLTAEQSQTNSKLMVGPIPPIQGSNNDNNILGSRKSKFIN